MIRSGHFFFIASFLAILFFINPPKLRAQVKIVINVSDTRSGVPIENANVTNLETGIIRTTDVGGNCLTTVFDKTRLSISHVSYRDTIIEVSADHKQIYVRLSSLELNIVEVYADQPFNKKAALGVNRVSLPFLTATPSFLGEPDILKGLTFLPGVTDGKEGYSHLFVRGGEQDQNQILLDGATMLNLNHIGGYISMFQPELVGGVDFYKNYWPSKFGGRLSSVLDIRTKEGNYKEHHQSFQFSLISPKFSASGPLIKDRLSYHVGMRRTIVDLATGAIARKIRRGDRTGDIGNLVSQDLTMRLDGRLSDKQHISLTALLGRDRHSFLENYPSYNQLSEDKYGIKNELIALNYRINLVPTTSLNAHASYSNYRHFYDIYSKTNDGSDFGGMDKNSLEVSSISGNSVRSIKFNIHGKTQVSDALDLNYGIEREEFQYGIYLRRREAVDGGIISDYYRDMDTRDVDNTALSADFSYIMTERFRVNSGIRISRHGHERSGTWLSEPKILLTYELDDRSTMNAAFNMQRQSAMLLGFTDDMGRFREFYIANDGISAPSLSKQWSIGYFRNPKGLLDNMSIELFLKDQSDVVKFAPSTDFEKDVVEYNDFLHRGGRMRTYGVEVLLQKTTGKLHGSLSYTYAKSQSMFGSLNQGNWFNSDFDFRNSVNFLMMYNFGKGYRLSGSWTYKTGRPFTMPTSMTEIEEWRSGFPIMGNLNNMRLPAVHRLDVNVERKWKTKRGNTRWFGIGVYNVYNRVNPFFAQPSDIPGKLEVTGMFPIMPSFNIGFEL